MRYTLSPKARDDLNAIWDYSAARWDADQAGRYIRHVVQTFAGLADGTVSGRNVDDIRSGYFRQRVGSHVIFYRRDAAGMVIVVRVLHQRMDMTRHL